MGTVASTPAHGQTVFTVSPFKSTIVCAVSQVLALMHTPAWMGPSRPLLLYRSNTLTILSGLGESIGRYDQVPASWLCQRTLTRIINTLCRA